MVIFVKRDLKRGVQQHGIVDIRAVDRLMRDVGLVVRGQEGHLELGVLFSVCPVHYFY
jgi:hypothetical protein